MNELTTADYHAKKVIEIIINPMTAIYRAGDQLPDDYSRKLKIATYITSLKFYSPEALQYAWQKHAEKHHSNYWVSPAILIDLCKEYQQSEDNKKRSTTEFSENNPLEKRRKASSDRIKRAGEYAARFMNGNLGSQAYAEGWESPLRMYVEHMAQAQIDIIEVGRAGLDGEYYGGEDEKKDQRRYELKKQLSRAKATGDIAVDVPYYLIDWWKTKRWGRVRLSE